MSRFRTPTSGAVLAAIGGVLGGLALGYVGWVGSLASMSLPGDLTLENSFSNALSLIGVLLMAAVVTVVSFVVGSLVGAKALPVLLDVGSPSARLPILLLLDVVVVPASIALIFYLEQWSPPLWISLGLAVLLVGGAAPAAAWFLAERFSTNESTQGLAGASSETDL